MPAQAKPRISPAGPDRFHVAYRGLKGELFKSAGAVGHTSWRGIIHGRTRTRRPCAGWTSTAAFEQLIEMMDEQADCAAALVRADALESAGGRDRLMLLGGAAALVAYDKALVGLQSFDAENCVTVLGMIKAATSRKPLAPVKVEVPHSWDKSKSYRLTVVPGFSVSFEDGPTYYIGDRAEHGSYNLHYFGTITKVTEKTITVRKNTGESAQRRLRLSEFAQRNASTPESKSEANHIASLNI